jgi:hypothetical protein
MRAEIAAGIAFPMSYINPAIDTLYIDGGRELNARKAYSDLISFSGLTRIAVNAYFSSTARSIPRYTCFLNMVKELANLQDIYVVGNDMSAPYKPWKHKCKGIITLSCREKEDRYDTLREENMKSLLGSVLPERDLETGQYVIRRGGQDPDDLWSDLVQARHDRYLLARAARQRLRDERRSVIAIGP